MNQQSFIHYQPTSSAIPFTFRYPAGWQIREIIEDEDDVELFVAGPRNKANTYSAAFSIRLWPKPAPTPEAAMADFLDRHGQLSDFQLTTQTWTLIGGNSALEVEISYTTHLPMHSVRSEKTQIQERRIFLPYGNTLLEFIYAATADMYADWLDAFHRMADSLTLIEEPFKTASTITDLPASVPLRETPPEYHRDNDGVEDSV